MRKNKSIFIRIGILVAASIIFSTSQVVAGKALLMLVRCTVWDLGVDYKVYPDQVNPNPDSCGNPAVWHFFRVDPARQNYTLLNIYINNTLGIPGLQQWSTAANISAVPLVGINASGQEQRPPGYTSVWPAGAVNVHPGWDEFGVVGWRSPIDGIVEVSGFVSDMDSGAGNGIRWYIDRNSTNLVSGDIVNGGKENFAEGSGGDQLRNVLVHVNDFLYFIIDPKDGNYGWDPTQLDVHISSSIIYLPVIVR